MTVCYMGYINVLKMLKRRITKKSRWHLVTLVMMIAGIFIGRNARLSAMSTEITVVAKEKSVVMQLLHWVNECSV